MKVIGALLLLTLTLFADISRCSMQEKFAWRELEFSWPSESERAQANYIQGNNLPLAFDVWKDKIFFTVPRWKEGVASTLNYIETSGDASKSPIFHPYPNLQTNQLPLNDNKVERDDEELNLISVFGIRIDECDRLWAVDSGVTDLLGQTKKYQKPSILVFDLNNSKLLRQFEIPAEQIKSESFFVNIYVDARATKCGETFAYMVDIYGFGIIVYDFEHNKSWRVNHHYFAFDPIATDLNVGGVNFQWGDGIFSIAMGKINNEFGDRTLYFHALSSTQEFSVENNVLKNESFSTSSTSFHAFNWLGSRGANRQSSIQVYDDITDVIFYIEVNNNAIGCWNTRKPFTIENLGLVGSDNEFLLFSNDLRIDSNGNLLALSNRMPLFIYKSLSSDDYNYRIVDLGQTSEIIKGTICEA